MDGYSSPFEFKTNPSFFFSNRSIFSLFRSNRKKQQGLSVIQKGTMKFPHLSKFPLIPPIWLRTANISFFASAGELLGHETAKTAISRLDRMGDTLERDYASWPR